MQIKLKKHESMKNKYTKGYGEGCIKKKNKARKQNRKMNKKENRNYVKNNRPEIKKINESSNEHEHI